MRQKGAAAMAAPETTTISQRKGRRMASYLCGIDIGGTFTDCVIVDNAGAVTTAKAPSTPHDFAEGVRDALKAAGAKLGLGLILMPDIPGNLDITKTLPDISNN